MSVRIIGPATKAEVPIWRELAGLIPDLEDDGRELGQARRPRMPESRKA